MERLQAWRSSASAFAAAALVATAVFALTAAPAGAQDAEPQLKSEPYYGIVFDFVPVGTTSDVRYATLSNPGTVPNQIKSVALAGRDHRDFSIADDQCVGRTLEPGARCVIGVQFRPLSGEDTRVAELRIEDSTVCQHWVRIAGSAGQTQAEPRARAAACQRSTTTVVNSSNSSSPPPLQAAPSDVVAFPKTCSSRRVIRIRVFAPRGTTLRAVSITLNGTPVSVRKVRGRFRATIDLRGRPRGSNTVRLRLTATNGKRYFGKRVYRTCGVAKGVGTPRY